LPFRDNLLNKPHAERVNSADLYTCLNEVQGIAQTDDPGQSLSTAIH
jgi:hypothetical protein